MDRYCVTTVVSGHYVHYIPMFLYSLKRAAPRAETLILCTEKGVSNTVYYPMKYPEKVSTVNCTRFLVEDHFFKGYDYIYFTDIDFIFLPHEPDFLSYYKKKRQDWGECYWGGRGPKRKKSQPLKRIRGGCFFATPEWFLRTSEMRERYRQDLMGGKIGAVREDDEVMLWYICAGSRMKCPTKRGNSRKRKYKEIHLGDFKFETRIGRKRKMAKRISRANMLKWFRLQEDEEWRKIRAECAKGAEVGDVMSKLDEYMEFRKKKEQARGCNSSIVQA